MTNNKQRVTLFLNPDLVKHAKAQAVIDEITLTVLVEKALIKYLPKETVIKKKIFHILGKHIKVELWDTNKEIINSIEE